MKLKFKKENITLLFSLLLLGGIVSNGIYHKSSLCKNPNTEDAKAEKKDQNANLSEEKIENENESLFVGCSGFF